MRHLTWSRLLAVTVFAVPISGQAQAPRPQVPPAVVRELATIEGDVSGFVSLPNGRALIYQIDDSTFSYDVATRRRTLLGTDMFPLTVSPQGDRLAFSRSAEDHTGDYLWTMPIDPKTGVATGPPHRVSLRPQGRRNARFSPDGKMLAFIAGPRPDRTSDIALVPAAGGTERVVATYLQSVAAFDWSTDSKALHVELNQGSKPDYRTAIERVPVAGGQSEPLFPTTPLTTHWVVGLSPDARVALFTNNPDRFFYRTASGAEGEISVPLPLLDDGWGHDFSLASTRYTTMTVVHHSSVRILDVASGKSRDLLPGTLPTSAPAWSPDGRKLAVLIGNLSHFEIAIMNADGSGLRRYPLPKDLNGWGEPWGGRRGMPWSPDGRYLALRARDRGEVGENDSERLAVLLDVTSGETRVLSRATERVESFLWRSDGQALRVLELTKASSASARWIVTEIPLKGPERQLRDISGEFPLPYNVVFMSDHEVALATAADKKTWYVLPLDGGAARRLPDPGTVDPGLRLGSGVVAGNRLLIAQVDGRVNEAKAITILSAGGDATRTVRPPASANVAVLPDDQGIGLVIKAPGGSGYNFFLAPLDGSTPRLVGPMTGGIGGQLAASPDGKSIAYTSEGRYTSKFHEIDFGPSLLALMKR